MTHLSEQLHREKRSKEMAQISIQSFKKQIEQQKEEIEAMENPQVAQRQEKTMLASAQLAAMKRQQSKPAGESAAQAGAQKAGKKK